VFGLLGATVAVSQIYLFPGLMMLAAARAVSDGAVAVNKGVRRDDGGGDRIVEGEAVDGDGGHHPLPHPWYIPRTAGGLRAVGWLLLGVAFCVCIVGTGTNVYSSFIHPG